MSLEGKMKNGRLYCEFGHELEENLSLIHI